jgi:hypothetical protein
MRMILASSRGTLMELGISPIITSGMIMQVRRSRPRRAPPVLFAARRPLFLRSPARARVLSPRRRAAADGRQDH